MSPRRPLLIVLLLAILGTITFITRTGNNGGKLKKVDNWIHAGAAESLDRVEGRPCSEHVAWLKPYKFSFPIRYVSRDIIALQAADGERPSLSIVDQPLFGDFTPVDLAKASTVDIQNCLPPLQLKVPHVRMRPQDASNMIFGVQTTMKRLNDTVKHLARWLPHTNARLYAIVIETEDLAADKGCMLKLQQEFHKQGMVVTIVHPVKPTHSFAQRYFSLVNVMYRARNEKTEWVICIDDDTFFPSMHDLQNLLKKYDSTKPQYIGSLSEDWWAVNHYGLMGFGGAGIMLSLPLAKILDDNTDICNENLRTTAGDITVMDCIYRFSSTKLNHVPGLHQVDMHGDLSGFYESGREMISLHHWKEGSATGFKLEMEKMHLIADICDSCFLQRWQFSGETILSNGFSVSQYPEGHVSGQNRGGLLGTRVGGTSVQKINLDEMEHTWGDDINVLHSLAPIRDKMTEEQKVSYKLLDSVKVNRDVVRQIYLKEGVDNGTGRREQDTVLVLNWRAGDEGPNKEGVRSL